MGISTAAYDSLSPTDLDNFTNLLRLPGDDGVMGILDASDTLLRIMTSRESIEVLPGKRSEVLAYRVERDGKIYLNPTIRVRTGANFSTELANGLDEETTIHWHGLHVDWRMDGHPLLPVAPTPPTAMPTPSRTGAAPTGITRMPTEPAPARRTRALLAFSSLRMRKNGGSPKRWT
jgi:Multicopper oxidase